MAKRGKTGPKSARKGSRKQAKQRAAAPEPTETDTVRQYCGASKLQSLLKQSRGLQGQMNSLSGSLREAIANAVKKDHLHKGAYSIIKRWDKMEPEALALEWDHLIEYWESSGLKERAESVQSLALEPAESSEEVVEEEEGPPTTIQPAEDDDKITRITDNVSTPRFGVAH